MIYRRYGGNAKDILSAPFLDGFELIEYALDAEKEDRLFLRWAIGYQSYMSFEDFKSELKESKSDTRSEDEILKIVKDIIG